MGKSSTLRRRFIPRGFLGSTAGAVLLACLELAACRAARPRQTGPKATAQGGTMSGGASGAQAGADATQKDGGPTANDSGTSPGDGGEAGHPDGSPTYRTEQCPSAWRSGLPAGCSAMGSSALGVRIRATVLGPGVVHRDGEIWIDAGGSIGCVGCDCSKVADPAALVLTCPDSVVSPGLVNPHDHISYAGTAPIAHAEKYEHRHDWRLGLRGHMPLPYEGSASSVEVLAHELRMAMSGVTATVSAGGQLGLVRNLDDGRLTESLRAGLIEAVPFPLDDSSGLLLDEGCAYGDLADDPAYTSGFSGYLPHIAEGIDSAANNELGCSDATLGILSANTAVVHALASDAETAAALRARRASVVWSPRSNVDLYGNTAPVTLLHRSGVRLALGTDWLASGSMNLLRELDCARALNFTYFAATFTSYDLWNMVTFNAAFAAGVERALGRLSVGYAADVSMFRGSSEDEFESVIAAGPADVRLVLRGGKPLYGDAALVSAFAAGSSCEPIHVCDVEKLACVFRDTGTALSELEASAELVYPLFSCQTPPAEPSCVPARDSEYSGVVSGADSDGDGVDNAIDLCPEIFDPVRPCDGSAQADADADGTGDACDACPLDSTNGCVPPSPDDVDADGIADVLDNCPRLSNGDQADSDGDGHGNACDGCAQANFGGSACVLPIPALRDPAHPEKPAPKSAVEIQRVFVTALRPNAGSSRGFYVQDASLAPYTGLFVYTADQSPGVDVGARVTLRGYADRYEGTDELIAPLIEIESPGGPLPFAPIPALPGDISDGGALARSHLSMLLLVEDVSVLVQNPDSPSDFDEFAVTANLRIDDWLHPDLDNTYAAGQSFSTITGILGFSFGHNKLYPRSLADLAP